MGLSEELCWREDPAVALSSSGPVWLHRLQFLFAPPWTLWRTALWRQLPGHRWDTKFAYKAIKAIFPKSKRFSNLENTRVKFKHFQRFPAPVWTLVKKILNPLTILLMWISKNYNHLLPCLILQCTHSEVLFCYSFWNAWRMLSAFQWICTYLHFILNKKINMQQKITAKFARAL